MRQTVLTVFLAGFSICTLNAQTVEDAFLLSENNYEGTARTIALGNAVTALGGDLGSVTINPAGSAVASYSQVTLTPGLSINKTTTQGIPPFQSNDLPYFQKRMQTSNTRFVLPNIGFSITLDTHRNRGLKNISFGFTANTTNSWNEDTYASGTNETTSYLGAMAVAATGFSPDELISDNAFNSVPWNLAIGYYTGMIAHMGNGYYAGATESAIAIKDEEGNITGYDIQNAGPINQKFGRRRLGSKYDYVFNVGFNISDKVFFGANLGITSASYTYNQYVHESSIDPNDFKIEMEDDKGQISVSYFDSMKYKSSYALNATGVYGKFGIIVTPVRGLRIGAAVQTPTGTWISERFEEAGEANFTGSGGGEYSETSPLGKNRYKLISPLRANFGVAYTFGFGLISADYEIANYNHMRYANADYEDNEYVMNVNDDISAIYGAAHHFRLGAEIKPLPSLSIRAGYGFSSSADKWDFDGNALPVLFQHDAALGIGYSSKGSFFMDAAVKREFRQNLAIKVYEDYYEDVENFPSPSILLKQAPWKVVLTLGWRF